MTFCLTSPVLTNITVLMLVQHTYLLGDVTLAMNCFEGDGHYG